MCTLHDAAKAGCHGTIDDPRALTWDPKAELVVDGPALPSPERISSPTLPPTLRSAGIDTTILPAVSLLKYHLKLQQQDQFDYETMLSRLWSLF